MNLLSQLVRQGVLCKFIVCILLSSFFDCTESSVDGFYFMPNDTMLTKVDENESSRLGAICGRSSSKRQYPWSVSLALHGFNKLNGVIISQYHILTVAHGFLRFDNSKHGACVVINYKEFQTVAMKNVLYGSDCIHFARTWKSLPPKCNQTKLQMGRIRAVAIDHRFAEGRCINGHDWAIIELEEPITFNDYVSPICLPFARQPIRPILTAAGWGRPSAFENTDPRINEKLMRHDETCTAPITDLMPTRSEDYLCAKSLDPTNPLSSRVCHGDSGSGLQQSDSNGITNTLQTNWRDLHVFQTMSIQSVD
ncbi:Peptidase S1 domain-containing protein [Aphelenchoides besseyi]|nr:Peptidase S1 domain-containing protein [Aphelenchoides besseyi]